MDSKFITVELEMGLRKACINVDEIISVTAKGTYKSEIKLRNGDIIVSTDDPDDICKMLTK